MQIIKEFKEFALKGNMVDLAIGVIIGGAFGKIIASIVNDLIMPPLGLITGGLDFKNLKIVLSRAADGTPAAAWNYGNFIQATIEFIIIALVIFLMIKAMNKMRKKEKDQAPAPAIPKQELLLTEIRDILKNNSK